MNPQPTEQKPFRPNKINGQYHQAMMMKLAAVYACRSPAKATQ
jgi:hypothetical protein